MAVHQGTIPQAIREELEMRTPDFFLEHLAYSVSSDAKALAGAITDAQNIGAVDFAAQRIAEAKTALAEAERSVLQRKHALMVA